MKGILLAGGRGSRLYPMTRAVSKHLLPIFDKPMIYYPLSTLMLAGISEILIISTSTALPLYYELLGDGRQLGIKIDYAVQDEPRGVADALIIGEKFIGQDSACLILGDNVFFGQSLSAMLNEVVDQINERGGAYVFGYPVRDARPFGVVEFDQAQRVISLEEKPQIPKSNYAVPGLYFYDSSASERAKGIYLSKRGELEITDLNNTYLMDGALSVALMGRGMAWLDTGTPEGLLKAAEFVEAIQSRQGFYVACIEEIAWRKGYISTEQLRAMGNVLKNTDYGQYLVSIASEKNE